MNIYRLSDFQGTSTNPEKGNHGYDNRLQSMKPIFYAAGPNIKKNYKTEPFKNVDIYPLICELLGIPPSPNNGSVARVRDFIVPGSTSGGRIIHLNTALVFVVFLVFALLQ